LARRSLGEGGSRRVFFVGQEAIAPWKLFDIIRRD